MWNLVLNFFATYHIWWKKVWKSFSSYSMCFLIWLFAYPYTIIHVYKLHHLTMLYLNFSKGQSSVHIHHKTYVGQGLVLNWLDQQKLCQLIFLHSIEENIYKGQHLLWLFNGSFTWCYKLTENIIDQKM